MIGFIMTLEDMQLAQSQMDLFRIEHADLKRRREAEFAEFRIEHADLKRRREAEFAALQLAFKTQRIAAKVEAKATKKADKEEIKKADKAEAERLTFLWEAEWRHALKKRQQQ